MRVLVSIEQELTPEQLAVRMKRIATCIQRGESAGRIKDNEGQHIGVWSVER